MKKNLLLLTLGMQAVCQLGYSENTDVKVEKTQIEDVKQTQDEVKTNEMENTENTETELKQSQEQEAEETNQAPKQVQKQAPKTKRLTPEQERRLEAKAKRNKEKNKYFSLTRLIHICYLSSSDLYSFLNAELSKKFPKINKYFKLYYVNRKCVDDTS